MRLTTLSCCLGTRCQLQAACLIGRGQNQRICVSFRAEGSRQRTSYLDQCIFQTLILHCSLFEISQGTNRPANHVYWHLFLGFTNLIWSTRPLQLNGNYTVHLHWHVLHWCQYVRSYVGKLTPYGVRPQSIMLDLKGWLTLVVYVSTSQVVPARSSRNCDHSRQMALPGNYISQSQRAASQTRDEIMKFFSTTNDGMG